jgi:putative phosphoribosyl transferase
MITRHATRTVTVPNPGATLFGDLAWPIHQGRVHGLTVVAHANSGSRLNPRNQALAAGLNAGGHATLLTDLLASDEDQWDAGAARARHDIALLTARMVTVLDRVARLEVEVAALPVAVLGTGTSSAAALHAAAALAGPARPVDAVAERGPAPPRPARVDAVVCRGGRPDLAVEVLADLPVPALFLVGEHDHDLREVHSRVGVGEVGRTELRMVPGAADLVEDGAAAQQVATLAAEWLTARLDPTPGT